MTEKKVLCAHKHIRVGKQYTIAVFSILYFN